MDLLLCTTISIDFNSQISFLLSYRLLRLMTTPRSVSDSTRVITLCQVMVIVAFRSVIFNVGEIAPKGAILCVNGVNL